MKLYEREISRSFVTSAPPPKYLHHVRVLVVEAQGDYREDVKAALRLRGAAVATAESVEKALRALTVFGPDVLVVDIELPAHELEMLHEHVHRLEIRQGRRIPEVAMTPAAMLEAQQRASEAGFRFYVSRPVEPSRLASVIARLVPRSPSAAVIRELRVHA